MSNFQSMTFASRAPIIRTKLAKASIRIDTTSQLGIFWNLTGSLTRCHNASSENVGNKRSPNLLQVE